MPKCGHPRKPVVGARLARFRRRLFGAVFLVAAVAAGATRAADSQREVIKTVFEVERPGTADLVVLRDGNRLTGTVSGESFALRASFGQLQLNTRWVAGIDLGSEASRAHQVALVNGDRLTGLVEWPVFSLQREAGKRVDLPATNVALVIFRIREEESGAVAPAPEISTNFEGLVWIRPGEFVMGSPAEESGREQDEGPQTRVVIAQGFWIGRCEVTQAEYQRVMGTNPSNSTGDPRQPVERVNWFEALEYCAKLTRSAEAAGRLPKGYAFRLPTEAEWEYCCRAGTTTRFSYGEDPGDLQFGEYAWFTRNSDSMPHPVGTRRPNPWGLYDLHGNVWEWCLDRWDGALPGGTVTNSAAAGTGSLRVARGGSWLYEPKACRSANRDDYSPYNRCSDLGFRVVLAPVPQ